MSSDRPSINRRKALCGAAMFGAVLEKTLASANADTPDGAMRVNLPPDYFSDAVTKLRTHVKMIGSLRDGTVCSFLRLNIYADQGKGNFIPLFTLNNIVVDHWTRTDEHQYEMRKFEVGYYSEYDSHRPIESFNNPLTGKTVAVHQFKLGPVPRVYTPDGVIAMGFTPKLLPIEIIGDRVFLATESIESRADPIRPDQTLYVNSFMTLSTPLGAILDEDVYSAPVHLQLQNKSHWLSWMGMEEQSGGTVARGYGSKIDSLEALPESIKVSARRYVPEIFDTLNWTEFLFEESEMLKAQQENAKTA